MSYTDFDKKMKGLELYHGLRVPEGAWPILRIDGRGFSGLTERLGLEKPFSVDFDDCMSETTRKLMESLGAVYGYHQSDEISLVLPKDTNIFDRSHEKLISVSAGLASTVFALHMSYRVPNLEDFPHFDSRLIVASTTELAVSYFRWRQQDAYRNALNSWCHWTAVLDDEMSPTAAGKLFENKPVDFKHEYLFQHGINFNDRPNWEKLGTGYAWTIFMKKGFNPKTQQETEVLRRKLDPIVGLRGPDYWEFLKELLVDNGP